MEIVYLFIYPDMKLVQLPSLPALEDLRQEYRSSRIYLVNPFTDPPWPLLKPVSSVT